MKNLPGKYPLVLILLAGSILYFVRLGSTDLQEWDEVFYASRAQAIVTDHQWLDQSQLAIGGLWTGSHPPLVIWSMACSARIFGSNEWAFRIPAALAGLVCLMMLFGLVYQLTRNKKLALLTSTLILLIPYFSKYCRMAQLDIPLLMWMTLTLYFFWLGVKKKFGNYFVAGIMLGMGVMSKIAAAWLCPMTIFFFLAGEFFFGSRKLARRGFWGLTVMTLIAIAIAAPWHILIHLKLGSSYWQQSWGYHVFSRLARPLEGHASNLGLFYWPLQTIGRLGVFFPFAIIGMTRRVPTLDPVARRFHWCWFLVPFLLFTLTATKFHTYFLLFLLPLLYFSAQGLDPFLSGSLSPSTMAIALFSALCSFFYSQIRPLQNALENLFAYLRHGTSCKPYDWIIFGLFVLFIILGLFLSFFVAKRFADKSFSKKMFRSICYMLSGITLIMSFSHFTVGNAPWMQTRTFLNRYQPKKVVFSGEDSIVNRFYLSLFKHRNYGPVLFKPADRDEDIVEKIKLIPTREVYIFQKRSFTCLPDIQGQAPVFANGEFILYTRPLPL